MSITLAKRWLHVGMGNPIFLIIPYFYLNHVNKIAQISYKHKSFNTK